MIELLRLWGLTFQHQVVWRQWILDFVLLTRNVVIEVHGQYWHDLPRSIERDARKKIELEATGFRVIYARTEHMHLWWRLLQLIADPPALFTI